MNKPLDSPERDVHISPEALRALGGPNVAYVKRVVVDGAVDYGIHAADGTALAVVGDRELAFAAARQHDLEPVSVH